MNWFNKVEREFHNSRIINKISSSSWWCQKARFFQFILRECAFQFCEKWEKLNTVWHSHHFQQSWKISKFCGISIVLSTSIKTCLHVKKTIIEINYSTKFSHHACQKRRLKFYEMFKYFPFMSKSQKLLPF